MATETMKAARIHEYGNAQVLRYEDAPRPQAGDGEVLVRVRAAGVNPVDWKIRAGFMKAMLPLSLPWIPGLDFSGVVEGVGRGVTDFKVGDAVFGKTDLPGNGSLAEYVSVKRASLVPKPASVDHAHAAAVPLAALTAWQALAKLELAAGKTVLVLGANGGVGSFAVQLAKARGARVVAVARSAEHTDHLKRLGADKVVDASRIDEAGEVDAVLDVVGGDLQKRAIALLRRGGAISSLMGQPIEADVKAREARGFAVMTQTDGAQLAEIGRLIDAGTVKVVVHEQLPLSSAQKAHELLEKGGVRGKIVVTVA